MKINPLNFEKVEEFNFGKIEQCSYISIFDKEVDGIVDKIGDTFIKVPARDIEKPLNRITQEQLSQNIVSTREDGIMIEIGDDYPGSISNDDNGKFIDVNNLYERISSYLKIKDKDGKEYKFELLTEGCADLIDLRRQCVLIMDYLKDLPSDILLKIVNNNHSDHISIVYPLTEDEEFYEYYLEELGGKTEGIVIFEDEAAGPMIFTSKIVLPPRSELKKNFEGERKDGYKIKITNTGDRTFDLQVKTPNGDVHKLQIRGIQYYSSDTRFYREILPVFTKILSELPANVLEDFINEISVIHLNNQSGGAAGQYFKGTNEITISFDWMMDSNARNIFVAQTFVHEIGHAIDAVNGEYATDVSREFIKQFNELKEIIQNYPSNNLEFNPSSHRFHQMTLADEHSFTSAQEMFAILYNKQQTGSLDHLESIEKYINAFATNSTDPEEKRAVELYRLLNETTQRIVNERRKLPKSERCNEKLSNFVKSKISNDDLNNYITLVNKHLASSSPGLEFLNLIDMVFMDNKEFAATIKSINKILTSPEYGQHFSGEVNESFENLMIKLVEIREEVAKFQQNKQHKFVK